MENRINPAVWLRLAISRQLVRIGFRDDSFLLLLAVAIGIVAAGAAVGFHEAIVAIRTLLYAQIDSNFLYGNGIALLILIPAVGGLAVGLITQYVFRTREGHGIVDVMESVVRSSGFIRPLAAVEKIITAAFTIGTGGSAGAEGPIVQIGAAIASGVGQLFKISRQHMPLLIGCGAAAGISAIFNSPIGGVLFALEVILFDFSIRTFTPVVMASVLANVTTQGIYLLMHSDYEAIFAMPVTAISLHADLRIHQMPVYLVLGILCGVVGVALTRLMYFSEEHVSFRSLPKALRPAMGGALVGLLGVLYVMFFGWFLLHQAKPFAFSQYPMPAFFGDGYGVIRRLFEPGFYTHGPKHVIALLAFLCGIKLVATCITLSSGGSGGIIAPSLFLGATAGGLLGIVLQRTGIFAAAQPEVYALVGMGAVLAAVVHAPLASILILSDLTHDYKVTLPAMMSAVIATSTARLIFRDSIYTGALRLRGVHVGGTADHSVLRRLTIEQVTLEPARLVHGFDPLQRVVDLLTITGTADFVVVDAQGEYAGLITSQDIQLALLQREALPLLLVRDLLREGVPPLHTNDDLSHALEAFGVHNVDHLPVCLPSSATKVIGLLSRAGLMARYQRGLAET